MGELVSICKCAAHVQMGDLMHKWQAYSQCEDAQVVQSNVVTFGL